jgi:uncharacterized protein
LSFRVYLALSMRPESAYDIIVLSNRPLPMSDSTQTVNRTRVRVHPERAVPDEAVEFLASGMVAHVAFVADGQPFVMPMTYHFDPAEPTRLYIHGGHHSRLVNEVRRGGNVCVEVTQVDGLVYSKSALHHSMNYRSVVVFARAASEANAPSVDEARRVFEGMIARYHPGRTAGRDYEPVPDAHLDATALIVLEIDEWSAKARRGGPKGPRDGEPHAPGSAGVIPLSMHS